MCRALLYLGEPVLLDDLLFRPDSALVKQSYMPRMLKMLNLAGFGMMAWDRQSANAEEPFQYRSVELPVFDANLGWMARKIRAHCLLGHVRGVSFTSRTPISRYCVHPFCYDGCKVALAHNGELYAFDEYRDELRAYIRPEIAKRIATTCDSEWIYATFLSQLRDPGALPSTSEVHRALEATIGILHDVRKRLGVSVSSSTNLFITDGQRAFALRYCFDFGCYPIGEPEQIGDTQLHYLSLWYTSGREYGFYDDEWKMIGGSDAADSVMIASEPLTTDISKWLEVPEYSLLYAARRDGKPRIEVHHLGS